MGAHLVGLVLTTWAPHISDRAFRILTRMAHTALDDASSGVPAGLYFGGREPLIAVLSEKSRKGKPETVYKEVRDLLAELVEKGAIERTNHARSGSNQVYQLRLDRTPRIGKPLVDNRINQAVQGGSTAPPEEGLTTPPQEGSTTPSRRGPQPLPRNQEEPVEEKSKETPGSQGPVTNAREAVPAQPKCEYPGCAKGFVLVDSDPPRIERCPQCTPTPDNVIPLFGERKAQ